MTTSTVNEVTIALRIIPVFLTENALLDDANTRLGCGSWAGPAAAVTKSQCQCSKLSYLDFWTSPVECALESLDGLSGLKIIAFTVERLQGIWKLLIETFVWKVASFMNFEVS